MKAILHIGLPKTGSSSIQEYLMSNQPLLNDANVYLPQCALPDISAYLLPDAATEINASSQIRKNLGINKQKDKIQAMQTKFLSDLKHELQQYPQTAKVIFTYEGLISHITTKTRTEKLKEILSKFFDSIQVIAYIRPQHQWLRSTFTQELRRGNIPLDLYKNQYKRRIVLKYTNRHTLWSDTFGEQNVIFRPFIRDKFHQKLLIADFCHYTSIPYNGDFHDTIKNLSLSPEGQINAMCINYLCQKNIITEQDRKKIFCFLNEKYTGKGFAPTNRQVKKIQRYFKQHNTLQACEEFSKPIEQSKDTPILTKKIIKIIKNPLFQQQTLEKIKGQMQNTSTDTNNE